MARHAKIEFASFFHELWGKAPFAWQERLATRVAGASASAQGAQGPWPEAIALPTASGKTACLDVAVFALAQASQRGSGLPVTAPRRIFFVVDRRVIVDEAFERARRMAEKLEQAKAGVLKAVADDLRRIARGGSDIEHNDDPPLAVHALRGGMYRSEAWLRNPLQPTIVASTVDQLGSRLLFRAYGCGPGIWPIGAALAANDSLVLLDEAHCAQPFLQTLQAVRRYREWADVPLNRCFHPVVMSATPPAGLGDVFKDSSGEGRDRSHTLGRRQLASKPAKLRVVPGTSGKDAADPFAAALKKSALNLLGRKRQAVVVFVNRVATARQTRRLLCENEDVDAILLTGRMRPLDKDATIRKLRTFDLDSASSADRDLARPVVVVATQTLEVGADLDFDGLVTECASLDALRQRFGRLNRMGRSVDARAEVLIRADQAKKRAEADPVYGEALTRTWQWLAARKNGDGEVDFGIAALDNTLAELADEDSLVQLNAPSDDALVMLPAHVDCWAQTAPQPQPTPDVAHFLHGQRESVPDVLACWRADIDLASTASQNDAMESLTLCPPCSSETLPVPIGLFKRWLAGRDVRDLSSDVEGVGSAEDNSDGVQGGISPNRRIIRWQGNRTDTKDITADPNAIRPGDVVVIPCTHPGDPQDLGDLPQEASHATATLDVGDAAHRMARAKPMLRLHRALVETWPDSLAAKPMALSLLDGLAQKYEDDPHDVAEAVQQILAALSHDEPPERLAWLPLAAGELAKELRTVAQLLRECRIVGSRSLILAGRRRVKDVIPEATMFSDEDDTVASGISHKDGKPVPLRTHLPGVETFARLHARACGLPEDLTEAVARAGLLHDLGKADPRFQAMLHGGLAWSAGEPLAKSARMPKTPAARKSARAASGYPQGARHELLSVRLAEAAPELLPSDNDLRDLVLHLVASHHGHCRPFAPVVADDEGAPAEYKLLGRRMQWTGPTGLERLDSGVAERYWRLTRRYGWWGLAWLEALLRLADWRRSEWEENHDASD